MYTMVESHFLNFTSKSTKKLVVPCSFSIKGQCAVHAVLLFLGSIRCTVRLNSTPQNAVDSFAMDISDQKEFSCDISSIRIHV